MGYKFLMQEIKAISQQQKSKAVALPMVETT